jgi:DNA-directed RNA polymerase specialized sigma24 family protein
MSERTVEAIQADLEQANAAVDAARAKAKAFARELAAAQARAKVGEVLAGLSPADRAAILGQEIKAQSAK